MVKIGMMIGDRYEILEKIGTGGMSDVYKAKCHKLNRFVAVKVLKQEFAENANFVSKFRVEAQAAAGLAHPNIVNVYDVGEENDIHYIVMELVEGITLKKYIEKKARLSYKEAVSIAIQVSMGIAMAHNNHIIHRDIKPQNIIISREGKVKVTDFGIAKAATSNTITSNVMGSVHYTSPEQARGGYSDEKSDIYSLGVTMFEMLTGRVPFNGETTVAVAIKHIQEEMPSPKEFVPEIPASVESIVMKCCQKSPDRRYQSMEELTADLKQSLLSPDEDFVVMQDPEMGGTRAITDEDVEQIKRRSIYQEIQDEYDEAGSMQPDEDMETDYPDDYPDNEGEDDYDYDPRMDHVTTFLAVLAGVAICVILVVLASKWLEQNHSEGGAPQSSRSPVVLGTEPESGVLQPEGNVVGQNPDGESVEMIPMPDVIGINVDDARNALITAGLLPMLTYAESDTIDAGVVIEASTEKNTEIPRGSAVTLTISAGRKTVEVPEVIELSFEEANTQLTNAGFQVNKMEEHSQDYAAGTVLRQNPIPRTLVPPESVVTLVVSLGPEDLKIQVPNLLLQTEADAVIIITENGLTLGTVDYVFHSEVEAGLVCYQNFSHGLFVDPATPIDIRISKGAPLTTFKCNMSIEGPGVSEAPDYVPGSEVALTLITDDGKVLLDTRVSSFPQAANYYGLTSEAGTITMTYIVTTPGSTTTDTTTGETVTTPGSTEAKTFTRRVTFMPE